MSRYRVGFMASLVEDIGWVIQKKKWWGWSDVYCYFEKKDAIGRAKWLEKCGHTVEYHI